MFNVAIFGEKKLLNSLKPNLRDFSRLYLLFPFLMGTLNMYWLLIKS